MYELIVLIGNLGRDPEMRYTPEGQAVTSFSLATNRQWNNAATGEKMKETTWWKVSAWGKQAENVNQYLHKGSKCLVEGRLVVDPATGAPRIWARKDTGAAACSLELSAHNIRFLDSKEDSERMQTEGGAPAQAEAPADVSNPPEEAPVTF
jgi:single-strand DNA-binding protein